MRKSVKKILSYSLTLMLVFSSFFITGCGNNESNNNNNEEVVKKTYNVTFDSAGGTEVASQSVTEGENVTRPIDPERECYAFAGWTLNGNRYYFSSTITSDITLVAEWTKVEEVWVVTLDKQDGGFTQKINVKKGEKLEKPADPEREGYVFVEWQLKEKKYDFDASVKSNITLVATWKEKTYTVKFDSVGGTSVANQTLTKGKTVTKPSKNPTKAGWTFVSWTLDGNDYDFKSEVTNDITLVATWKLEKKYSKEESITKKINKKNVKIDFRYLSKATGVDIDVFVNEVKSFTINVKNEAVVDFNCTSDSDKVTEAECLRFSQDYIKSIKDKGIGIIKGDKEYFYFNLEATTKIYIVNDLGTLLYSGTHYGSGGAITVLFDSTCLNYDKFKRNELPDNSVYISSDGIYYLDFYTDLQLKEYKISVNKNKVTTSEVAVCIGTTGLKGADYMYILTKTKKVNNKNVTLEYRFETDNESIIKADLYINNKKIANDVYKVDFYDEFDNKYKDKFDMITTNGWPQNQDEINAKIDYWNNVSEYLDENIGIVKGDKEYLYIITKILNGGNIIVVNESGALITNQPVGMKDLGNSHLAKADCKYVKENKYYTITSNAIYYLVPSKEWTDENGYWHTSSNEYKLTFKNNKAVKEKVNTCSSEISLSGDINDVRKVFEDMDYPEP